MSWIPSSIQVKDVSYTFVTRVPKFLADLSDNESIVLLVSRNETNTTFLSHLHPTDHSFYFYMDKYMSLPLDLTTIEPDELLRKGNEFFTHE